MRNGILPPALEEDGLKIFKGKLPAIEGLLKAKLADKEAIEHIIKTYEEI